MIIVRSLIHVIAVGGALIAGSAAVAQDAGRQKVGDFTVYNYKELFDMGANPLGWRRVAGQKVAVLGGHFFNVARLPNAPKETWLITLRSSLYTTDVITCGVAPASLDIVSTLRPNDPVTIAGTLAGSPHDNRPAFDGDCLVVIPKKQGAAQAQMQATGPAVAEATLSANEYQTAITGNSVAFSQKYKGKAITVTGGKVGDIHPNFIEITHAVGAPPNQRQAPFLNCFATPSAIASLATLTRGQEVSVTGSWTEGNLRRAINGGAILDNCTWK